MKKLITHDGSFHSDDVFAAAALSLYLKKKGEAFKIIRSRNEKNIKNGNYVFDLGGIYDEKLNRFDHHQINGAGKRKNGLEYSSFGLVWKKFGQKITGREEADFIEQKLVMPIDANDNGLDLSRSNFEGILPYTIDDVVSIFSQTALENLDQDKQFFKALVWAKEILKREIKKSHDRIKIAKIVQNFYKNSPNKKLIVINKPKVSRYEVSNALQDFPEPLFVVYSSSEDWRVLAMRKEKNSFKNRKDFPAIWAGLRDEKLQKVTGVSDSIFCHRGLFLAVAKSKEGAIKLAELALSA